MQHATWLPHIWPTSGSTRELGLLASISIPWRSSKLTLKHSSSRIAVHCRGGTTTIIIDNVRCSAQNRCKLPYCKANGSWHARPSHACGSGMSLCCILAASKTQVVCRECFDRDTFSLHMARCLASRSRLPGTRPARTNGRVKATQNVIHRALHMVDCTHVHLRGPDKPVRLGVWRWDARNVAPTLLHTARPCQPLWLSPCSDGSGAFSQETMHAQEKTNLRNGAAKQLLLRMGCADVTMRCTFHAHLLARRPPWAGSWPAAVATAPAELPRPWA